MANPATEKLAKILKLEAQTGYTDKAVTRGLQSFAAAWLADAAKNDVDAEWAESIAQDMRDYSAATELASRQSKLNALFEKLGKEVKSQNSEGRSQTNDVRRETTERRTTTYVEEREKPRLVVSSGQTSSLTHPTLQKSQSSNLSSAPRGSAAGLGLDAPVTKISGVGDANALKFNKLGVKTIRDLLYYFPVRYEDYSAMKTIDQLYFGEQVTLVGRIASARRQKTKNNLMIVKAVVEDESGMIECSWFTSERFVDSLMKRLEVGREVVVSGKVTEYLGRLSFQNPTLEPAEKDWLTGGSIVPVYSLTEGLQQLFVRRLMKRVSEYWSQRAPDFLPQSVRRETRMMALGDALREIHFPRDTRSQEQARRRLAFDELFVLQMAVLKQRQLWRGEPAPEIRAGEPTLDRCIASLPYQLTGAQRRAVQAVYNDIRKPMAMHRLLQGDVGSGKTVVAALGMALSASVGSQSALMAPTEILSEQHYKNLQTLFEAMNAKGALPKPIQIALLTGSVKASEKRAIYDRLASGEIHVVVGTHALIQEGVSFDNLGFVVIDEQHRFGVEQRTALRQKGALSPHTLVMTATPIPRTLALTLYGDLDNTVLDEMPPGRQPIETHWVTPAERERAYGFVRSQIETGRQAFVICPLVQESEKIEAKAAVEEYERLKSVFPKFTLGLLHGKMKAADKDEAMSAFARGETNLLVSTSVVEVGIDVPNATVMMIEGANRFGLSQLHQFRGRVGRGQHKSYCLLVADSTSDVSDQRLQAIVSSQDGFRLAEIDLEIRGPGEFFGTRQSGEPELKLVGIRDRDLLTLARNQAEKVIEADPTITSPENKLLSERVEAFWLRRAAGDAS
jgi:ATP-dependent DNA helicase RecG